MKKKCLELVRAGEAMEGIKVDYGGVSGVFLAAVLKSVKSEMTMLVAAGVSVLILFLYSVGTFGNRRAVKNATGVHRNQRKIYRNPR